MKRWAWALLSIATLAHDASAADPVQPPNVGSRTVVLLRSGASDEVTTEATSRVEGELGAAGFHVEVVAPRGDDARQELETAGSALHAIAAFAIVVRPSGGHTVAEIWVSDRLKQTTVIQRAELSGTDHHRESEILAVRAVELLKASLAELWTEPPVSPPPAAPPIPVSRPAERPPRLETPRSATHHAFAAGPGVGLGVGLLDGFVGGAGVVWAPLVLLSYGWENGFSLQLDLHGFGPTVDLSAPVGAARVQEQFGTLDVVKTWWPRSPVVPFMRAGVGAQHVHVSGEASTPSYAGTTVDYWAPVSSAGLGVAVPVYSGISVVVQARGLLAWPPTEVRIAQVDAGRFGGPSMLVDAHVLGVFP
jgi:hypothetical protein